MCALIKLRHVRRGRMPRGAARGSLHARLIDKLRDALVQLIDARPQLVNATGYAVGHRLEPRLLRA